MNMLYRVNCQSGNGSSMMNLCPEPSRFAKLLYLHPCFTKILSLLYRTKDSLAGGNYLSVINVLMQLRKVLGDLTARN